MVRTLFTLGLRDEWIENKGKRERKNEPVEKDTGSFHGIKCRKRKL